MKFSYKFSNLLGSVYRKGNLIFTADGNTVISPVGNRITFHDLKNNKSSTLPVESDYNYTALDLSPNGCMLIAVNEVGDAHLISMISRTVVHKYRFRSKIKFVKFSPDGKHFAACKQRNVFVFKAPGQFAGEFNPFVMERTYHDAFDDTTCIDWTSDSRVLAVGCKDTSARVYCLDKVANFRTVTLGSQSDAVVGVFFEKDSLDVTTVARNGRVCVWECNIELNDLVPWEPPGKKVRAAAADDDAEDDVDDSKGEQKTEGLEEGTVNNKEDEASKSAPERLKYKLLARHYLRDLVQGRDVMLTTAAYHKPTHILVTGFSNGCFFIHELPDVNLIHSLSISENPISALALNDTGDWIAVGCKAQGQLLVWEWQSETYVMKQQGHSQAMTCLAYSIDGLYIVTGGEDGKVKLWNTQSGFCFVTFSEHTSGISAVVFANNRKFLVSASLDGTVRAYDVIRYRNFRTFTSPRPVQFVSLALDSAGEFVAAGGQDVFEIYLWSMKIGRLVEVLSGHEGPVVGIAFNPSTGSTALASVSWDKTLRLWNAVESGSHYESVHLTHDGLAVAYRPDGKEVAVTTLNGNITTFNVQTADETGCIEGRNDLGSGRSDTDIITSKKSLLGKAFTSLCYSADGLYILAGGQSKNVCIYNVAETILVKKIEITQNRSFDAVNDMVNRKNMTEFGNIALVEEREPLEGGKVALRLPGAKKGDMAARSFKPEVRVFCVQFSPTGQAWAAVTTEGLLIYSLDPGYLFDPFHLDTSITPDSVRATLKEKDYATALMMSLRLNEQHLIREIVELVPTSHVDLVAVSLPDIYSEKLLKFVALILESTQHIEFYLLWIRSLVTNKKPPPVPTLLLLQKNLSTKYNDLAKICDFNKYTMQFLKRVGPIRRKAKLNAEKSDIEDAFEMEEEEEEEEDNREDECEEERGFFMETD